MLEELLKYERLGSKQEILTILFRVLSPVLYKKISDVKAICLHYSYAYGGSFYGVLQLLETLKFIHVKDNEIKLDLVVSNYTENTFFESKVFYERLFNLLYEVKLLDSIFNFHSTKYDNFSNVYYIKDSQIPIKLSGIKKVLVGTSFFIKKNDIQGIYFVNPIFKLFFEDCVIGRLKTKSKQRKTTLDDLKNTLLLQEKYGEEAERFVLQYEQKRLKNHPQLSEIKIISSSFVNAGYDIESFDDIDSILTDRLIEVKSYRSEIQFYWSVNEINTAKEHSDLYYLYLVDRSKISVDGYQPLIIKDPFKKIYLNEEWQKEANTYFLYRI